MPFTPHVVIDARMLRHAGIGRYIQNIVPRVTAAKPDWRFTLLVPSSADMAAAWTIPGRVVLQRCTSGIYSIAEQLEIVWRTPSDADLFWAPHYNVPVLSRIPLVVTVHDVIHLALADLYGGGLRLAYARGMFEVVRRRARMVLFDSRFTRGEFERLVGTTADTATIHLGVDASWAAAVDQPPPQSRPYLLFVGSVKPHKNLVTLIRAFGTLLSSIEHDLVIVGEHDRQRTIDDQALRTAAQLGDRVKILGIVDDATLKQYVSHAAALVFPSLYEGFGLPPLEAMAAGCPCIVSTAASLPEVCGDAVLYCDPRDPGSIAKQIMRLVREPALRAQLREAGRARAAEFTWERAALNTADALEHALRKT
jgi:glycosyltransferase involved in cell wall biosynthesis